jgi:drug/metabolite transporter (DMT)-like permease
MLVATLIFMPLSFAEFNAFSLSMISWKAWAGFICNVIMGMVLGMAPWGLAVKKYGARHCAVYLYLQPILTLAIAALLLRENIGMIKALGTLIILLGVWLASAEERVVHA